MGVLCGAAFEAPLTSTLKGTADWAAFCVDVGESCYVEPSSDITVGNYTTPKESIGFQVTGLTPGEYDCYVATILPKTMVCSDAVSVNTTVRSGIFPAAAEVEPVANQEATFTEIPEDTSNPARFEELNQATFTELPLEDIGGEVTSGVATFTPLE